MPAQMQINAVPKQYNNKMWLILMNLEKYNAGYIQRRLLTNVKRSAQVMLDHPHFHNLTLARNDTVKPIILLTVFTIAVEELV